MRALDHVCANANKTHVAQRDKVRAPLVVSTEFGIESGLTAILTS